MSGKRAKRLRAVEKATVESPKRRIPRLAAILLPFAFGAVVATAVTVVIVSTNNGTNAPTVAGTGIRYAEPPPGRTIDPSLIDTETMMVRTWRKLDSPDELLKFTPEELEKVDIAEMNLLCATGLPGAGGLHISKILMSLDAYLASFIRQADSRIAAREYAKANRGASTQPVVVRRPQYRPRDFDEELRRVEAINAYNRRLMEQHMRPPTPPSPYGPQVPQPAVPNPYRPHQSPVPGQPPR